MSDFDFKKFVNEFSQLDEDAQLSMLGTPLEKLYSNYAADCIALGIEEMDSVFPDDGARALVVAGAISSAISAIMSDTSIETMSMISLATTSTTIRKIMYGVFYYALGLSIKEELR